MRHLSAKASWALFGIVLLLLISVGIVAARLTHSLADSEQWVSHTHEVQAVLGNLRGRVLSADNLRLRALVMTPAPTAPDYASISQEARADWERVKLLTSDNPRQQARLADLSKMLDDKFSVLNRSVALMKAQGPDQEQDRLSIESLQVSNQIMDLVEVMDSEERALLSGREHVSSVTYSQVRVALIIAFAVAVLILSFTFFQLTVELRDRKRAEESVRKLSARLLQLQDAERRKVARELHDSIGQYFVSLKMNFDLMQLGAAKEEMDRIFIDCIDLLDRGIAEARTLSHLLHPPLLDEAGFVSAARWYVDGFTERSKIRVTLEAPELPRMPKDIELALFRVLQESLTNIHRHSGSQSAEIRLAILDGSINLFVRDHGKGIPAALLKQFESTHTGTGIGLAGIRERMIELGGTMELSSDDAGGTTVEVSVPLPKDSSLRTSGNSPTNASVAAGTRRKNNHEDTSGLLLIDAIG
jgi:signal transduction histidine kinase